MHLVDLVSPDSHRDPKLHNSAVHVGLRNSRVSHCHRQLSVTSARYSERYSSDKQTSGQVAIKCALFVIQQFDGEIIKMKIMDKLAT